MSYSKHVAEKAGRLLAEGRVREVEQPRVFLVNGSAAAPYSVIVNAGTGVYCSCPSTVKCAHLAAAEHLIAREREEAV